MSLQAVMMLITGLFGGLVWAAPAPSMPRSSTIDLGYSQYQGMSLPNGIDQYLGMRYAKPPLGELRFRAPQDPETTLGILDASSVMLLNLGTSTESN